MVAVIKTVCVYQSQLLLKTKLDGLRLLDSLGRHICGRYRRLNPIVASAPASLIILCCSTNCCYCSCAIIVLTVAIQVQVYYFCVIVLTAAIVPSHCKRKQDVIKQARSVLRVGYTVFVFFTVIFSRASLLVLRSGVKSILKLYLSKSIVTDGKTTRSKVESID